MRSCSHAADTMLAGFLFVFVVCIGLAGAVGWVLNIVKLAPMDGATGMLVLRGFGIVLAPLGAVLGYLG
ncbi:hypothetical protein [Variovorax paradoxus]|uniref:hypothetical protein n=1 Tax=Variovorax paradoxus TaxID=34073 RepID=UPI0019311A37|nr:hypothetical protein INQ48_20520 [Variovorax paradoxus]